MTASSAENVGPAYVPAPAESRLPAAEGKPVLLIPSLGRRVAWAVCTGRALDRRDRDHPVVPPRSRQRLRDRNTGSLVGLAALGVAFAAVGAARYVSRPTRAFGPLTIAASLMSFVYLLYLIPIASIGFQHADNVSVAIYFGRFLQYCLLAPLFGMAAGAVTTYEDVARPRERINYEYAL